MTTPDRKPPRVTAPAHPRATYGDRLLELRAQSIDRTEAESAELLDCLADVVLEMYDVSPNTPGVTRTRRPSKAPKMRERT